MEPPKRIRPLDPQLVNRIAAGEIIQRPCNALKELIENSLDAGSTSINIQIRDGGLKLVHITDNGCGIARDDLTLICERFTTSKLERFEDLSSIHTFGFRGEALASISHVSRLTIMTRTCTSPCGYKASYLDGRLDPAKPIQPCAMSSHGTQIIVEDLFYNCPLRKNALKTNNEEFAKIYEVVSRYAIHNYHCSFFLKRLNEANGGVDVKTTAAPSRSPEHEKYLYDAITSIYGSLLKEKIEKISIDLDEKYKFEMSAYMANAKVFTFVLFINERLVDCQPLKKCLQNLFAQYLPKNEYLFVYMNLRLDPNNLDVNVHPTKHEVRFLYQDEIVNKIQNAFEQRFLNATSTRTYYVQNLTIDSYLPDSKKGLNESLGGGEKKSGSQTGPVVYPYQMTRVDSREQKLDSFLHPTSLEKSIRAIKENKSQSQSSQDSGSDTNGETRRSALRNTPLQRNLNLTSLNELRDLIEKTSSKSMLDVLQNMTFVGCLDRELAVVQHQTSLFILNTQTLSRELFYQLVVFHFGNLGYFRLEQPMSIYELALLALDDPDAEWTPDDGPKDKLARRCAKFLNSKAMLLDDYFSIKIKRVMVEKDNEQQPDYYLEALPMLIEDLDPDLAELPMFLLRLVSAVDWKDERECIDSICKEIAFFYSIKNTNANNIDDLLVDSQTAKSDEKKVPKENWRIEHVMYKAFKNFLLPSKETAKSVKYKLVDTTALYKVFERC